MAKDCTRIFVFSISSLNFDHPQSSRTDDKEQRKKSVEEEEEDCLFSQAVYLFTTTGIDKRHVQDEFLSAMMNL